MSYPDFRSVAYISGDQKAAAAVIHAARTAGKHIAIIGDSQETTPGSSGRGGDMFAAYMNYEAFLRYKNVPFTPIALVDSYDSLWLSDNARWAADVTTSRIAADLIPMGYGPMLLKQTAGLGMVSQLCWTNQQYADPTDLQYGRYWPITASSTLTAQIIAATNASSDEVAWSSRPSDRSGSAPDYYATSVADGTTAMGLQSATFAYKTANITIGAATGKLFPQIQLLNSASVGLDLVCAPRWINPVSKGITFSAIARGGETLTRFLNGGDGYYGSVNWGPMLAATPYDMWTIHLGANDATGGDGITAAAWYDLLILTIARCKSIFGNTAAGIIFGDVYNTGMTGDKLTEANQYAGAEAAAAVASTGVVAVNTRRMLDDRGLNATNQAVFLADGVHYTQDGARAIAAAKASAMWLIEDAYVGTAYRFKTRTAADVDVAVSTRMAAASYTPPPSASSIATAAAGAILVTPANKINTNASNQVAAVIKATDNIDFTAAQKTSLNAATPEVTVEVNTTAIAEAVVVAIGDSISPTINLSPLTVSFVDPSRIAERDFTVLQTEAPSITWTIAGSDGVAVDYRARKVRLVAFTLESTVKTYQFLHESDGSDGSVTLGNGTIKIDFTSVDTATVMTVNYDLWDVTDANKPTAIAYGKISIVPAMLTGDS